MGVYQDVYEADENLEDELEDFLDEITHPVESVLSTKQVSMLEELKQRGMIWWWEEYVTRQRWPVERLLKLFQVDPGKANQLANASPEKAGKLLQSAIMRFLRRREKIPAYNTPDHVVELIQKSKNIIVLTGAGISVSCGIPDFRSRNGIYAEIRENNHYDLDDPQQMFDINYFKYDPSMFYSFAHKIYPSNYVPSVTHYFIRALQEKGKLLRNYTQNIDTLESRAGVTRVLQCHGSFATAHCIQCKATVPGHEIEDDILSKRVPICKDCDAQSKKEKNKNRKRKRRSWEGDDDSEDEGYPPYVMKPGITFFGESLSSNFDKKLQRDREEVDLLLIIGTSLNVAPVSEIMSHIPHNVPQVLINKTWIHHASPDVALLGYCDTIILSLFQKLKWDLPKEVEARLKDDDLIQPRPSWNHKFVKREGDGMDQPPISLHRHVHLYLGSGEHHGDQPPPPPPPKGNNTADFAEQGDLDLKVEGSKQLPHNDIRGLRSDVPDRTTPKGRPFEISVNA